ncbi:uncharacterized protein LOC142357358 [Convolutriloba macropyga]|uniref:uncharacterized protein LOC142357358 n=1 Tax=Convolutriloba macropyga TaxID=536237 RepID=UPI003F52459B
MVSFHDDPATVGGTNHTPLHKPQQAAPTPSATSPQTLSPPSPTSLGPPRTVSKPCPRAPDPASPAPVWTSVPRPSATAFSFSQQANVYRHQIQNYLEPDFHRTPDYIRFEQAWRQPPQFHAAADTGVAELRAKVAALSQRVQEASRQQRLSPEAMDAKLQEMFDTIFDLAMPPLSRRGSPTRRSRTQLHGHRFRAAKDTSFCFGSRRRRSHSASRSPSASRSARRSVSPPFNPMTTPSTKAPQQSPPYSPSYGSPAGQQSYDSGPSSATNRRQQQTSLSGQPNAAPARTAAGAAAMAPSSNGSEAPPKLSPVSRASSRPMQASPSGSPASAFSVPLRRVEWPGEQSQGQPSPRMTSTPPSPRASPGEGLSTGQQSYASTEEPPPLPAPPPALPPAALPSCADGRSTRQQQLLHPAEPVSAPVPHHGGASVPSSGHADLRSLRFGTSERSNSAGPSAPTTPKSHPMTPSEASFLSDAAVAASESASEYSRAAMPGTFPVVLGVDSSGAVRSAEKPSASTEHPVVVTGSSQGHSRAYGQAPLSSAGLSPSGNPDPLLPPPPSLPAHADNSARGSESDTAEPQYALLGGGRWAARHASPGVVSQQLAIFEDE